MEAIRQKEIKMLKSQLKRVYYVYQTRGIEDVPRPNMISQESLTHSSKSTMILRKLKPIGQSKIIINKSRD